MSLEKHVFAGMLAFGVIGTAALAFGDSNLPAMGLIKAILTHPVPPAQAPVAPSQVEPAPSLSDIVMRLSRA